MFGSNTRSLPAPFAREHRPLCLTSESSRPRPTGKCHFQLLHPAAQNQICACQIYQHDRGAPGNVCDCGHSACYHGATTSEKARDTDSVLSAEVAEKIRKLEEMILAEREIRTSMMARERQTWEMEIRILREALAPFYRSDQEMQRRLLHLEEKLGRSLGTSFHLHEQLLTIDDTDLTYGNHTNTSRLDNIPLRSLHHDDRLSVRHTSIQVSDDVPGLTSSDERSTSSSFSRHVTPSEATDPAPVLEPESPRSSGILNLVNFPRPTVPAYNVPRRTSKLVVDEPRSSGFLGVDLKARMKQQTVHPDASSQPLRSPSPTARSQIPRHQQSPTPSTTMSLSSNNRCSTPRYLPRPSPSVNSCGYTSGSGYMSGDQAFWEASNSKKRKHQQSRDMMALDVLANVSAASTLICSRVGMPTKG